MYMCACKCANVNVSVSVHVAHAQDANTGQRHCERDETYIRLDADGDDFFPGSGSETRNYGDGTLHLRHL